MMFGAIPSDWLFGLLGGLMIGTAAAILLLINGRIMGASGLLGSLVDGSAGRQWLDNAAFVAGVVLAPALIVWLGMRAPSTNVTGNWLVIVLGGLLVGFGTRLGNGCTSGHGVCGISRLSPRGIIATLVYLGAGGLTMLIARHGLEVI
ncbi:YeeE/YedE family protein [Aquicoccus sp. G2-2]|uniref:YeeE/YedE family protein n=1 Tax=Aquicoccus sp. G2-2 TaxID=3092120 RepID=UPI002AE0A6C1|nr:YeeE/YedE thiosulfate transporter family protein [Aquicoccus sp. G2-2]MEA1115164.1 YeeE/YedE thiosulfate transporter family protein [Aquicoccus sp. G2-2]